MKANKQYQYPFVLEPTKLTRLVDKIHERLAEKSDTIPRDDFDVFMSGNRHDEMTTLDAVLAVENSRRNKIERLVVRSSVGPDASRADREIQVGFATKFTTSSGTQTVVDVSIRSDEAGWASRTLSEVEEQIERTRVQRMQPLVLLVGLLLFLAFVAASQLELRAPSSEAVRAMWLSDPDLDRLTQILNQRRNLTDDEMREIFTRQLRNVLNDQRPKPVRKGRTESLALFFLLPAAVVVACVVVLITTCYPQAVFLWGDEVERYSATVQRRKVLWGVITGILVIGVMANLLSSGLASRVQR